MIFVFGSNLAGRHGRGAAKVAHTLHGALYGQGVGLQGSSYAIPTKDRGLNSLDLGQINTYIRRFLRFANDHHELTFQVTRIGCGLAGNRDEDIAPMFTHAPKNCLFDERWSLWLGQKHKYWGTHP